MPDMAPENETELEARCLLFLQAAGRDPRDAVALATALSPLVPVIRSWVFAKIRRKGGIPHGARGRCEPEDIASTVLCRLQERPPTDRELEVRAIARLRGWVKRVTENILTDLDRAAASRRELAHGGERDPIVLARAHEDCEPEQALTPGLPKNLDELNAVLPQDLLRGKELAMYRKDCENARRDPPVTDVCLGEELGETAANVQQLRHRYKIKLMFWVRTYKDMYL